MVDLVFFENAAFLVLAPNLGVSFISLYTLLERLRGFWLRNSVLMLLRRILLEYTDVLSTLVFLSLYEHVTFWLHTGHSSSLGSWRNRRSVTDVTSRLEDKVLRL